MLSETIKASIHLQFILKLDSMNYSQPLRSRNDLGYPDKIKMLQDYEYRLSNLGSATTNMVDIGHFQSGFTLSKSPELFTFAHGSRLLLSNHSLHFLQLASRNRGTASSDWALENLGINFSYATADPDSDLLILFESLFDHNIVKVHLRSARSGEVHPAALDPVLVSTIQSSGARVNIDSQIIGKVLVMVVRAIDGDTHLVIWDWTSGTQLTVSGRTL